MEAIERFGVRWTGSHDFAESGVPDSITAGDVSALVAFQATLPPPTVKADLPDDWRAGGQGRRRDLQRDRLRLVPYADLAAEVARVHRSRALRHGGHAALRRSQGADPHRSRRPALRQDAAEERQGRVADPPLQRSQAPSRRRRDGQCARQRIAGAALRRARRVPHASALGRRLDRALWPQRLASACSTRSSPRMAETRDLRATRIWRSIPRSATASSLSCARWSSRRNDADRRLHPRASHRPDGSARRRRPAKAAGRRAPHA